AAVPPLPLLGDAPLGTQRQPARGQFGRAALGDLLRGPGPPGRVDRHGSVSRCRASAAAALPPATFARAAASDRDHSSAPTCLVDMTTPPEVWHTLVTAGAPTALRSRSYRWSPTVTEMPSTAGSRPASRALSRPSRRTSTSSGGRVADSTLSSIPEYSDRSSVCRRNWAASSSRSRLDRGVPCVIRASHRVTDGFQASRTPPVAAPQASPLAPAGHPAPAPTQIG